MKNKQQILFTLREAYDRWEDLLASLTETQITAPLYPSDWTIKDVVAHLRAWQQRSIARLEAALHDREPRYPQWPSDLDPEPEGQPHSLNAWLYETYREQPWSSVYPNWRDGFLRFLELGEAIPEEALFAEGKYPWLEGYTLSAVFRGSYEHHQEHYETLVTWLQEHGQSNPLDTAQRVFDLLEGTWIGEGRAFFPTIDTFEYRETLTYTRQNDNSLFYEQRTEKRLQGQETFLTSHWESGFLRILEKGGVELINAQSGGRSEVLAGTVETMDQNVRLSFVSQGLMNDERMIASARTFEINQGTLKYEMGMKTTRVDSLTPHLTATLQRVS